MIMLMVSSGRLSVFADDTVRMPELIGDEASLVIQTKYTDEDKTTEINGIELSIFKVATITAWGGGVWFKSTPEFEEVEVNYDGMTANDSLKAAKLLFAHAQEKGLEGTKKISENGQADFGSVPFGMYLVAQTGAQQDGKNFQAIEPFLVMVPQPMVEMGVNDWNYDVVSIPKLVLGAYEPPPGKEVKGEYEDKTKSAQTGDYTNMYIWAALLMTAAFVLIITGMMRRRRREDN